MAKIDVESAYRNIPVHPDDRHLLAMSWNGRLFVDTQLPFGLRSAPLIFSAVADALEWIAYDNGISFCLHYLDDFLTIGTAGTDECERNLQLLTSTCTHLGVPLKHEKMEGPSTTLTFLGISIDTVAGTLSLPDEKLQRYKATLRQWYNRKAAKKREILSLIGKLAHACKVVRPGRTFLRRMIQTAASRSKLDHWIRLDQEFRSDLSWWILFLDAWNGRTMLTSIAATITLPDPQLTFYTDASGKWGCGAVWHPKWLQCEWAGHWTDENIAAKELLPIVLACAVWGRQWQHKHLHCFCDNMAVVEIWASQTSKHPLIMHLLRCVHLFVAYYDLTLSIQHVPGKLNVLADAISRNLLQVMHTASPPLCQYPTPVPSSLWQMLVTLRPDWLSPHWSQLWTASLMPV